MSNSMEISDNVLIPPTDSVPCGVCHQLFSSAGTRASHQKSSVEACTGCRAFFRRTARIGLRYECKTGRQCSIEGPKRKSCRYCRFQRCVAVGMTRRKAATHTEVATPQCLDYSSGFDQKQRPNQTDAHNLSLSTSASTLSAQVSRATVDFQLSYSDQIVLQYALQQLMNSKIEVMQRSPEVLDQVDESVFERQLLANLTLVGQSLKACTWLSALSNTNQNILTDNFEPHAMLFNLIGATLSATDSGDALVLQDGQHAIARSDIVANSALRKLADGLLEEVIPAFRQNNVDDRELALLRLLALWNSNLPCLDTAGKASVENIRQLLHNCLWNYCAKGRVEDFTFAESPAVRYWDLMDLLQSIQNLVHLMRNYLMQLRQAVVQDNEDFEFDTISFLL